MTKLTTHNSAHRLCRSNRRGAMTIMVLVCLVIVFLGTALAIDIAYIHTTRAQLRTATDAASRAGAEALGRTQNLDIARQAAIDVAAQNLVAGEPLVLRPEDIEFGKNNRSGSDRFQFVVNDTQPDSVRVTGARTEDSASGPVPLFFAPLFGTTEFRPVMTSASSATTRDVALVLDISGSMRTRTATGSRMSDLVNAVNVFVDEIQRSSPNTQLSLSVYSSTARRDMPLTANLESIRDRVSELGTGGMTAIGMGLMAGSDSLMFDPTARSFSAKTIVIMTDGNHNRNTSPLDTVHTAVARNQTVHTITFSPGANQNLMRQVAELGQGIHVHADENEELEEAFREIARTIAVVLIQ